MTKFYLTKFISIAAISSIAVLFSIQTFAATVKLVSQSSTSIKELPSNSTAVIYFDEGNELSLDYEKADSSYYLANVCNSRVSIDGSPSHQIILREPKVDVQRCLPRAPYPYNVDYLLGLKSDDDSVLWKHKLTLPLNARDGDYRMVIGVSKDGIVLQSLHTGLIEIIDPTTGAELYPGKDKTSIIMKELGSATYDATNQILYKTSVSRTNNQPSALFKIDLKTGEKTQLAPLPTPFQTKEPAGTYNMMLTFDKHYLLVLAHVTSKSYPHDIFMVYDLRENKWIYQSEIDSPLPAASSIIMEENSNNIGLLSNNGRGKLSVKHYIINDETTKATVENPNALKTATSAESTESDDEE